MFIRHSEQPAVKWVLYPCCQLKSRKKAVQAQFLQPVTQGPIALCRMDREQVMGVTPDSSSSQVMATPRKAVPSSTALTQRRGKSTMARTWPCLRWAAWATVSHAGSSELPPSLGKSRRLSIPPSGPPSSLASLALLGLSCLYLWFPALLSCPPTSFSCPPTSLSSVSIASQTQWPDLRPHLTPIAAMTSLLPNADPFLP